MKVGPLPRVSLHRTPTSINQVFYKGIDHPNRIVPIDPVFQALRKQRRLPAIDLLNEAPHPIPSAKAAESDSANQITKCVFTQPEARTSFDASGSDFRSYPERGHSLALQYLTKRANSNIAPSPSVPDWRSLVVEPPAERADVPYNQ